MWCPKSIRPHLFFLFTGMIFPGCGRQGPRSVTPAFYHWQTTFNITSAEREYLDSLGCRKLYVKLLDVGRSENSGEITPYSLLDAGEPGNIRGMDIVPVVFITNEVFKNTTNGQLDWLAGKVAGVLTGFEKTLNTGLINEIQIDCDWTPSTREPFFLFLQKIRRLLPENARLSATIRLHQYKFPEQTGVPPVDRGMLMFYNTGDIESDGDQNSIFYPADAQKYVAGAAAGYPLPLDLALPVFSWGLVYRDDDLWKIIPEISDAILKDTSRFVAFPGNTREISPRFSVKNGTFLSGHYLRPGDMLRIEAVSPALLYEAARLAAKTDLADHTTVAFFQLDTLALRRYPVQLLDSVCRTICIPQ